MKKIRKSPEPQHIKTFLRRHPDADWETFRDHGDYSGLRGQFIQDQGGLCAYCENDISKTSNQRVEHFHPKRDRSQHHWALDWTNMFAVCLGGSSKYGDQAHSLEPFDENRSCDVSKEERFKNNVVEGRLLNPFEIPAFPSLFGVGIDGTISPNEQNCLSVTIENNQYPTTRELVAQTIFAFHLNCERLKRQRKFVLTGIDQRIRIIRQKYQGRPLARARKEGMQNLAQSYFSKQWPPFFTTIRSRLTPYFESWLKSNGFNG